MTSDLPIYITIVCAALTPFVAWGTNYDYVPQWMPKVTITLLAVALVASSVGHLVAS